MTAPLAAGGLIAGYAVGGRHRLASARWARARGVRTGLYRDWLRRDGRRTATLLTIAGLAAFALSHVIALVISPWPAVLLAAASVGVLSWRLSDSRQVDLKWPAAGTRAGSWL